MKAIFGEKGFTLIEMLLVLTMIAAIVGVALPSFRAMQHEGNTTRAKGDLRTLQTAVESYKMHQGKLPTAITDVEGVTPMVVNKVPYDPFNPTAETVYEYTASGNNYVIYSWGHNETKDTTTVDGTGVTSAEDNIWVSNQPEKK